MNLFRIIPERSDDPDEFDETLWEAEVFVNVATLVLGAAAALGALALAKRAREFARR